MTERRLRLVLAGVLAGTLALLGLLVAGPTAAQAPVGPLTFSSAMTAGLEPAGRMGVAFPSDNDGVYVTFTFSGLPQGSNLSRIVRVDGEDYNWDDQNGALRCCPNGGSGRYGFPIMERDSSEIGQLPGGSYEVLLYLNGAQVQAGGFVIGRGGDNNNNNNNSDGGDSNNNNNNSDDEESNNNNNNNNNNSDAGENDNGS